MLRKLLFTLLLLLATCTQAQPIDSLFAAVPREVLPLLDTTARLDLLDLYNSRLTAKTENSFGGQAELNLKTDDFLELTTSAVGRWQMKLMDHPQHPFICVVRLLNAGDTYSAVELYDRQWKPVLAAQVPAPTLQQFFAPSAALSTFRTEQLQALLQRQPVVAEWTGQGRCLRFAVSLGGLSQEDRRDAALCLHSVCYEWKKATFEEVKEEIR